ncbi:hypothetical protein [Burkholderia pyrrocinia]
MRHYLRVFRPAGVIMHADKRRNQWLDGSRCGGRETSAPVRKARHATLDDRRMAERPHSAPLSINGLRWRPDGVPTGAQRQ